MESKEKFDKRDQQRGIYLILVAFFLFVLVALCGLVIGLGFISTNKSRLQNIANVSSIAALDSFVQARNSSGVLMAYDARRAEGLKRANELIEANGKLPGMRLALKDVGLSPAGGDGGKLTYGVWYSETPLTPIPSCSEYPCFVPNVTSDPSSFANAVKLDLSSQPTNPLVAPFVSIFGNQGIDLNTSSIARVVQRCVAFLLDVSMSTVQETHVSTDFKIAQPACVPGAAGCVPCYPPSFPGGPCTVSVQRTLAPTPGLVVQTPYPVSLFAYRMSSLQVPGPGGTPSGYAYATPAGASAHACQNMENFFSTGDEFLYYCNMPPVRTPGVIPTPYTQHFRSDYKPHPSIWGTVYVDKLEENLTGYVGPQPLSRFFLAFNAGLRAVNQIRSPGDKALLYVFTGAVVGTEPISTPPYNLTENFNTLIQLTNIYNRGTHHSDNSAAHPVITPNFVSRGFFPILVPNGAAVANSTNLAQALWDAMIALGNCPDSARRSIIVATDGIPSCDWNRFPVNGTPQPNPDLDCPPPANGDYYSNYLAAEAKILSTIKDELVKRGIGVTAILDSELIEPNFINATAAPGPGTPTGEFINPEDAKSNGYCAGVPGTSCTKPFFNVAPLVPDMNAFNAWRNNPANSPQPGDEENHYAFLMKDGPQFGVKFRRPNALWGQLALDTQGVICPLLPNCPPQAYAVATPPALLPTWRAGMSTINCSPIKQDKAQQAINCVLAAIGVNPYQNVEEIPPTYAAPAP